MKTRWSKIALDYDRRLGVVAKSKGKRKYALMALIPERVLKLKTLFKHQQKRQFDLPMRMMFFSSISFSIIQLSSCSNNPKYKILAILYWDQSWPTTSGKVLILLVNVASTLHQWGRRKIVATKIGHIIEMPNIGWSPPSTLFMNSSPHQTSILLLMLWNSNEENYFITYVFY